MSVLLWVLQVLLALHTLMGAVWKLSNSEQSVPSLSAIPHAGWRALMVVELLCAVGLVAVAAHQGLAMLVPVAAAGIALEMLMFTGVHLKSGDSQRGPMYYWLGVAAACIFVAIGRLVLAPF